MRMKKTKLDPNKIIKVPPRMENEGPDFNILIVLIIGIALGLFLVSCDQQTKVEQKPKEPLELSKDPNTENYYLKVTEYTYEGCEYIKVGYGKSIWGSHKGNCQNPIHKGQHPSPYMLDIPKTILDVEDTSIDKIEFSN